ncbi:hypothetical protein K440DRAFT_551663 [Wilcoxina mikolae CBS 423.85]|nr:hypothetical protein K440DRAFT_551663 [Wilcoxina mikolae CBS 423.85]
MSSKLYSAPGVTLKLTVPSIIAIHGLNGHAYETWTATTDQNPQTAALVPNTTPTSSPSSPLPLPNPNDNNRTLWLRDLLPKEVPNTRIFTFGYDARVAGTKSVSRIPDIATILLSNISMEVDEDRPKPIIFICHSLGGIVCKKAIHIAKDNPDYNPLYRLIRGVVFMGTPHRGADAASLGALCAAAVKSVGVPVNDKFIRSLKRGSNDLTDISNSFRNCQEHLVRIVSFYELESPIVTQESANLWSTNEQAIGLQANHRDMVKFGTAESPQFKAVGGQIKQLVYRVVHAPPESV